jgi:hypothetical protein
MFLREEKNKEIQEFIKNHRKINDTQINLLKVKSLLLKQKIFGHGNGTAHGFYSVSCSASVSHHSFWLRLVRVGLKELQFEK